MKTRFNLVPVLLLMGVLFFSSCNNDDDMEDMVEKNVVEVAASAGQFTILLEAAQKAGLAEALSTTENITVFAPTDAAFAKIAPEKLKALIAGSAQQALGGGSAAALGERLLGGALKR